MSDDGRRYRIVRFYRDDRPAYRPKGKNFRRLTLEQARAHCSREDTHEKDEDGLTVWFDGYEEHKPR